MKEEVLSHIKTVQGNPQNIRAKMNKEDIVYQRKMGRNLHIRFVYPQQDSASDSKKWPLVMHIQGSAWLDQNLNDHLLDLKSIIEAGYILAIVEYYPVPKAIFPSQIEDAKLAMQYIVQHANEHQVDTENLFLSGDSSGGYVALMSWATWNTNELSINKLKLPTIRAVIDLYGVVDITTLHEQNPTGGHHKLNGPECLMLGGNLEINPEIGNGVSVLPYIRKEIDSVPLLIMHGNKDERVPIEQSIQLYSYCLKMGKTVEFYQVKEGKHGLSAFYSKDVLQVIVDFLNNHLKK